MKMTQRGFTLIELLVVIAIIGLLSSVIMSSLNAGRTKARDSRRLQDTQAILTVLEYHYQTYGFYPGTPDSWYGSNGGDQWIPDLVDEFTGSLPMDPINENPFPGEPELIYYYATNGQDYCFQISQENDCSRNSHYAGVWGGTCKLDFNTSAEYCDSL